MLSNTALSRILGLEAATRYDGANLHGRLHAPIQEDAAEGEADASEPGVLPPGGATALHHAAQSGAYIEVRRLLQDPGVNVNATDTSAGGNGATPLHYACQFGHADVVELLLAAGRQPADVSALTSFSRETPHACAIRSGHHRCAAAIEACVQAERQLAVDLLPRAQALAKKMGSDSTSAEDTEEFAEVAMKGWESSKRHRGGQPAKAATSKADPVHTKLLRLCAKSHVHLAQLRLEDGDTGAAREAAQVGLAAAAEEQGGRSRDKELEEARRELEHIDRKAKATVEDFKSIDVDGSGTLTVTELMELYDEKTAREMFLKIDTDASGRIDIEEFARAHAAPSLAMELKKARSGLNDAQKCFKKKNYGGALVAALRGLEADLAGLKAEKIVTSLEEMVVQAGHKRALELMDDGQSGDAPGALTCIQCALQIQPSNKELRQLALRVKSHAQRVLQAETRVQAVEGQAEELQAHAMVLQASASEWQRRAAEADMKRSAAEAQVDAALEQQSTLSRALSLETDRADEATRLFEELEGHAVWLCEQRGSAFRHAEESAGRVVVAEATSIFAEERTGHEIAVRQKAERAMAGAMMAEGVARQATAQAEAKYLGEKERREKLRSILDKLEQEKQLADAKCAAAERIAAQCKSDREVAVEKARQATRKFSELLEARSGAEQQLAYWKAKVEQVTARANGNQENISVLEKRIAFEVEMKTRALQESVYWQKRSGITEPMSKLEQSAILSKATRTNLESLQHKTVNQMNSNQMERSTLGGVLLSRPRTAGDAPEIRDLTTGVMFSKTSSGELNNLKLGAGERWAGVRSMLAPSGGGTLPSI